MDRQNALWTFKKKALKRANKEVLDEVALRKFLRKCRMKPNTNTPAGSSAATVMFATNVNSAFDKLLHSDERTTRNDNPVFFSFSFQN